MGRIKDWLSEISNDPKKKKVLIGVTAGIGCAAAVLVGVTAFSLGDIKESYRSASASELLPSAENGYNEAGGLIADIDWNTQIGVDADGNPIYAAKGLVNGVGGYDMFGAPIKADSLVATGVDKNGLSIYGNYSAVRQARIRGIKNITETGKNTDIDWNSVVARDKDGNPIYGSLSKNPDLIGYDAAGNPIYKSGTAQIGLTDSGLPIYDYSAASIIRVKGLDGQYGFGADGASGANGANGTNGANGANGIGRDGSNGANGSNGSSSVANVTDGRNGSNGANGSNGQAGANGSNGSSGRNGANGANGRGIDGSAGRNGTNGSNGTNGLDGWGWSGNNGTDGKNGTNGSNGSNGTSTIGRDGSNGANGSNGSNGQAGANGSNGKDYSKDITALETKINTLQRALDEAKKTGDVTELKKTVTELQGQLDAANKTIAGQQAASNQQSASIKDYLSIINGLTSEVSDLKGLTTEQAQELSSRSTALEESLRNMQGLTASDKAALEAELLKYKDALAKAESDAATNSKALQAAIDKNKAASDAANKSLTDSTTALGNRISSVNSELDGKINNLSEITGSMDNVVYRYTVDENTGIPTITFSPSLNHSTND